MKFYFPDSQDQIDPSFNFVTESRAEFRQRQRDDLYAHEVLNPPPFDGILVSKAIVDGVGASKSGKYSIGQRERLRRDGAHRFFRTPGRRIKFLGDCGAYSYKDEPEPPFSASEVVEFYEECGFDFGISVDHLVLGFDPLDGQHLPGFEPDYTQAAVRQQLTLELAKEFMKLQRGAGFTPIGVAQGWSPSTYARAVRDLQKMGYEYVALGSMVPLRTPDILTTLEAVGRVRRSNTKIHLLGVTRVQHMKRFAAQGVVSFDSTSPFLQSFKDDRDNYYTSGGAFTAIRVPQVEGNPRLQKMIAAGAVDPRVARRLEQAALGALWAYDKGQTSKAAVLKALRAYAEATGETRDRSAAYSEVLEARPWKECRCGICQAIGIDVVIFRGTERNKRRGFHNLYVFAGRLHQRRVRTRTSTRSLA